MEIVKRSGGHGGEAQAAEVSMATKGKNPVQEVQASAIKPVAWLDGQGDGWGQRENRKAEPTVGCCHWN